MKFPRENFFHEISCSKRCYKVRLGFLWLKAPRIMSPLVEGLWLIQSNGLISVLWGRPWLTCLNGTLFGLPTGTIHQRVQNTPVNRDEETMTFSICTKSLADWLENERTANRLISQRIGGRKTNWNRLHVWLRVISSFRTSQPNSSVCKEKATNLKEHLHDNPSHSSGGGYIIHACSVLIWSRCRVPGLGRSVLSNGKCLKAAFQTARVTDWLTDLQTD